MPRRLTGAALMQALDFRITRSLSIILRGYAAQAHGLQCMLI